MNEEELSRSMKEMVNYQKKVVEAIERQEVKKKDNWDKFLALTKGIATILGGLTVFIVPLVGYYFTHVYNTHQNAIYELDVTAKFIPYLTGDDESKKKAAVLTLQKLGSPGLAIGLAELYKSPGTEAGTDVIMTSGVSTSQTQTPSSIIAASPSVVKMDKAPGLKTGWAYLGHYRTKTGKWETNYFDFEEDTKPQSLKGQTEVPVNEKTGTLNVREGMPTPSATFLEIIDVLKPGSKVKVLEVTEWQSSGYMWARISYFPK